jgi:bifunctional DNase/RNase
VIELEFFGIHRELPLNQPMVLLREVGGSGRVLPIWVGDAEGEAIARVLRGEEAPRPMTHDLLADVLGALEVELEAVHVTALVDATFHAELHLRSPLGSHVVSCRPSDAVALVVRLGDVPILGAEEVLDEAGLVVEEREDSIVGTDPEEEVRQFREFLEAVGPEDFLDES